jgi:inorganic pyrophosphatase
MSKQLKIVPVIVESPKGSTHKYDYDPSLQRFKLNKVLPAGLSFPFDFGFIPETKGEDGDPLDVIVISEIKDLPGEIIGQLENFFTNYNEQAGKKFSVKGRLSAAQAGRLLK